MKILLILLFTASNLLYSASPKKSEDQVSIQLISEYSEITPGKSFYVALKMTMKKDWHTYWRYAGDSGLPTEISWDLPDGFTVSKINWPTPHKIEFDGLANYGYENEVYLLATIDAPKDLDLDKEITISAKASWLVCKEICLSQTGIAKTTVRSSNILSARNTSLDKWIEKLPVKNPFDLSAQIVGDSIIISGIEREDIEFFPYQELTYQNGFKQELKDGNLKLKLDEYRVEDPKFVKGIITNHKTSWEINIPIEGLE